MIQENHIEEALKGLFAGLKFTPEPAGLYDPLRYMMEIGGKRIRPRLCLTAYSLYKDSFSDEILSPAAALEVFHSFTLIHDDIMDKADVRRGVPTVYKKWDENTAILSGDVMSIESYKLLAKAPAEVLPQALELFSKTAAEVCEGQQYDMDFEDLESVPMSDYLKMIGLKTAVLIACIYASHTLIAYPIVSRFALSKSPAVLITIVGTIVAILGALLTLAVMVDVKSARGNFFYSSSVSASVFRN